MSAKLYTCPECGRRGVTEVEGRHGGRFRCRYCGHYPLWLRAPWLDVGDRRELIAERVRHGQEVIGEFCARMTGK
jgi:DNA-directed RNA polymerase subunit RPC12/RpoP